MAAFDSIPQRSSMGQHPNHGNGNLQEASYLRGGASSQANRKANETRARSSDRDDELESNLYELWQFIPENNNNGGKNWKSVSRELIPSDQATLENLVKTMEDEDSVEEQWERLSSNKQTLIKALVKEHDQRDDRYKWSYVYIKTKTRQVRGIGNQRPITLKMEVILLRELQHQPMSAGGSLKASTAGRAGSQNSGVPSNLSGGQPVLDDMTRQAVNAQAIGNGPGGYKAAENRGMPVNGGVPSMHPQVDPRMYHQVHPQVQSPQYIYEQPSPHPQANPQVRLQGQRPAQPGPQQQGHPQVYEQMQNYATPRGVQFNGAQDQGMQKGQAAGNFAPKVSHLPNNVPLMSGGINTGPGPSARNGDEATHPAHKSSTPIYTRNSPGMQAQNARFATADLPQAARKAQATATPPKVVQQDRRASHMQDDSSFMTEDESLFDEEDGYSSAASSVSSIAKGSLHREKRYMRRDTGDREHRTHYRKQSQKSYSHGGYPYGNVEILPSASSHRSRESRGYRDTNRASNRPVTVHERELDIRAPGLAELELSANEASYRLMKMEETQRTMLDKMDRLSIGLQKPESRDYLERAVAVRGIEPEIRHAVPARPVYYMEAPMHPPRLRYVPREMPPHMPQPYAYDPYYF